MWSSVYSQSFHYQCFHPPCRYLPALMSDSCAEITALFKLMKVQAPNNCFKTDFVLDGLFPPSFGLHNKIRPGIGLEKNCFIQLWKPFSAWVAPNYKQQNYLGQTALLGIRIQAWPTELEGCLHQTTMSIPLCPLLLLLHHLLFPSAVCPNKELPFPFQQHYLYFRKTEEASSSATFWVKRIFSQVIAFCQISSGNKVNCSC